MTILDAVPVAAGYAIGSIPFALLAGKLSGIDVRAHGSGNPGATNVARTMGFAAGAAVAILDIAKGAASVLAAERMQSSPGVVAAAGAAAVVGHVFPIWLRFRGGKGVATACGVFAVLAPFATVLAASVFLVVSLVTRYISLGSILAAAALPSLTYITHSPVQAIAASLGVAALVILRHRRNVGRLLAGAEPRL